MKLKVCVLALMSLLIISCSKDKKNEVKEKSIKIGMVDGWAEGVAMTHVAKEVLTREGYDVDVERAAVDLVFASLSNGDTDVFMDAWLPRTHGEKVKKFPNIQSLGVLYDNAKIGLVVPSYVNINSIEELNANKAKFDGKIIGIEKGAGLTAATDEAIVEYGLELEQLNSSSIAMVTEQQKAVSENRWVVVAGWAPHWKFARFDIKFLEDPKGVYGDAERIETYARENFQNDDPFAAEFLSKVHFDDATMADLLNKMEDGEDKDAVAKQWVDDNQELVNQWLAK